MESSGESFSELESAKRIKTKRVEKKDYEISMTGDLSFLISLYGSTGQTHFKLCPRYKKSSWDAGSLVV